MSTPPAPLISDADYAAIEAAVMETARGRWFLAEYAQRNRNADTTAVLDAVRRLEQAVEGGRETGQAERLRFDLIDMAGAIARTKAEIAAIKPEGEGGRIGEATNELDAIVRSTETATGDILAAAEHLQEVAWTMREAGVETAACEIIDQRATDIYTACSFQDITGQRIRKVIQVLRYLEDRLNAMIVIWGAGEPPPPPLDLRGSKDAFLSGPALPGQGMEQSDVDAIWAEEAPAEPPPLKMETVLRPLPLAPPVPASEPMPVSRAAQPAAGSPFTPPMRPRPPARSTPEEGAGEEAPRRAPARPVTLADIEALPFEERAALFS
ncbi:protein phosphatase CheZ [Labrys wisconsinensis]|uniref:Chemotaxis protein CheZ n=1 Tax=Labrys wisconsinensis TaxID=425677 RepID=A0ABU0JHX9_9HYPH|nr:protein phosphatase CheZ [Labrys wisconsinensis]MDQ0473023.1 hypothetical protein [Labrys wisconsinensis]